MNICGVKHWNNYELRKVQISTKEYTRLPLATIFIWPVLQLDLLNFGCFVSSRCELFHCNAMRKSIKARMNWHKIERFEYTPGGLVAFGSYHQKYACTEYSLWMIGRETLDTLGFLKMKQLEIWSRILRFQLHFCQNVIILFCKFHQIKRGFF